MGPGPDADTGRLPSPVWHGRARTLSGALLLASGGALLVACSVASPPTGTPGAPTPGAPASSPSVSSAPAPSASAQGTDDPPAPDAGEPSGPPAQGFTVGDRREDAIAVAQASEHRVEAFTLALAEAGVSYVVHAACAGEGWMRYRLTVDGREVSGSRLRCGRDVVNTAFTAEGGERVQLHLDAPAGEGTGSLAEVVPAP